MRALAALATLLVSLAATACTSSMTDPVRPGEPTLKPNLPLPTLGGAQLWADVRWRDGWRLQENVLTGHARLLDPHNLRRAWGDAAACLAEFDARVPRRTPPTVDERPLVILLHGMGRTRVSFGRMKDALEADGWRCARLSYPSTRRSIPEHAAWLEGVLAALAEDGQAQRVSFVTHSLGGILVRAALARGGSWRTTLGVERLVMLGPPNQGSAFADRLAGNRVFRWLYGETGPGLVPAEVQLIPPPDVPFLIIAGARGSARGWNPWLPGDDDGVVALQETHLPGASGHQVVRSIHAYLAAHKDVIAQTQAFLSEN